MSNDQTVKALLADAIALLHGFRSSDDKLAVIDKARAIVSEARDRLRAEEASPRD